MQAIEERVAELWVAVERAPDREAERARVDRLLAPLVILCARPECPNATRCPDYRSRG